MARKKIVAGNWKMNMTPSQAVKLVEELKPLVVSDDVEVVYCVPAIDIVPVVEAVKGTNVAVGAENMYYEEKGAYTGEIAPEMLVDAGVKYVIIGHSERRDYFKECDCMLNKKVKKAFEHNLTPILCCGETLEQREMGITLDWIRMQIKSDLKDVTAEQVASMVIAYEPIWAIGTGKTATTEQAEEVCKAIRDCIKEVYGADTAEKVRIQYGGSVNAGNAAELFAQPDIDGGLVGGASLKADFGKIVNYKLIIIRLRGFYLGVKAEGIPFSLDICGKCEIYEKENSTDPDMCPDYNLRLERDGKRMEPGRKNGFGI